MRGWAGDHRPLPARARSGNGKAFRQLIEPHRHELQVHCYRILGSLADAEDLLQETLLAARQGLPGFQERASLRSWLYRIATNRCPNWLRSANRRTTVEAARLPVEPPEPTRLGEITWLEPYPDTRLARVHTYISEQSAWSAAPWPPASKPPGIGGMRRRRAACASRCVIDSALWLGAHCRRYARRAVIWLKCDQGTHNMPVCAASRNRGIPVNLSQVGPAARASTAALAMRGGVA
jgi:RNA polymerase sigma factor (sigma-70 family)